MENISVSRFTFKYKGLIKIFLVILLALLLSGFALLAITPDVVQVSEGDPARTFITGTALITGPVYIDRINAQDDGDDADSDGQVAYLLSHTRSGRITISGTVAGQAISPTTGLTFAGPDLVVSKSGPAEATTGSPVTYTLTVGNDGPLTATKVVVTDTFPAGASFISQTSSYSYAYSAADNTVVWQVGDLPAGDSAKIMLRVLIDSETTGPVINRITGASREIDLDLSNNEAVVTTAILASNSRLRLEPDTSAVSAIHPLPVLQGTTGTVTAAIHNVGTAPLSNLFIEPPSSIPWLTVTPTTVSQLDLSQSLVFSISADTDLTTPLGRYWDVITVTAANHPAERLKLEVYVHPGLVNLPITVTNDLSETLVGALVSLTKSTVSDFYIKGNPVSSGYTPTYLNYQTDENGAALIEDMEVGSYDYLIQAEGHTALRGQFTLTPGAQGFAPPALQSLPGLVFEPDQLLAGVAAGGALHRNVTIRNTGPGYASNFRIETPGHLPWLSGGWADSDVTGLAPSEAISLTVLLSPPEGASSIQENGYITVTAASLARDIDFEARLTATIDIAANQAADYFFDVVELDGGVSISGATVSLINQVAQNSYTLNTDINGRVLFTDLPPGKYTYYIDAAGYYNTAGVIEVSPISPEDDARAASPLAPLKTGRRQNGRIVALEADPFSDNNHEQAVLELSGDATLEGQAFLATLKLDNLSEQPFENIAVDLGVKNAAGEDIAAGFALIPTAPTTPGDLPPGQSLSHRWTLTPDALDIEDPNGTIFYVQAQIVYTHAGTVSTVDTLPAQITVLPRPRIRLNLTHNQPDDDGSFYLEVKAENLGYGAVRNLNLDLSQLTLLPTPDGDRRSLIFDLRKTTINGQIQPPAYIFNFGDLQPDEIKVGRWEAAVRPNDKDGRPLIEPRITGFGVQCTHQPYQDAALSSLIVDCGPVNQWFLADECPFCSANEGQEGGPIHTGSGNYTYSQNTPGVPTLAGPLELEWTFNSLNTGAFPDLPPLTSTLGVGWSHNYDISLDLSEIDRPNHIVSFKAFHGTPLKFEYIKGRYRPAPGVHGSLISGPSPVIRGQLVYTLTAANQAGYIFDHEGRLVEQFDPQGNVTAFDYDAQGRLERAREPVSQRYLAFTYNAQGRLDRVADNGRRTTAFGYQTFPITPGQTITLLTAVTDTRRQVWRYNYTRLRGGQYLLSHIIDPDGRTVEKTGFDDLGRAISQTSRGKTLAIQYFNDGRRVIKDGLNRETIHLYNNQNRLVSTFDALTQTDVSVLDASANQIYSEDKNGHPTSYSRTPMGLTTAMTDALGHRTVFEYDDHNNLTRSVDALGYETTYRYDEQNNLLQTTNALSRSTVYTYNAQGQTIGVTDENGHTTRYGYDALGQRAVVTDALGHATRYAYDSVGRVVTTTDASGKVTVNTYDDGDNLVKVTENYLAGQPQNHQNEYNLATAYEYDGAGRRIKTIDALGRVNRNEYDQAGRLARTIQNEHPTVAAQNYRREYNLATEYRYDEAGNQAAIIDPLGRETRTEYDALNRPARTIVNYVDGLYDPARPDEDVINRSEYDANGNLTAAFDALNRETRTKYDALNRLEQTIVNYQDGEYNPTQPDEDLITRYTYNEIGDRETVTDPLGRVTTHAYDDLNRIEVVTDPLGGVTRYTYNAAGDQTAVTDAEGRTTRTEYDALGRVTTTTNALGDQTTVAYDEVGNRIAVTDPNGHATTFEYDSLNRLIAVTDAESQTTAAAYDPLGNRLTTTDPEGQTTAFSYDSLNRVIQTTNPLSGATRATYDALGNRLTMTDANSHTTTYQYDQLNRLVRTTDPNSLTTVIGYDALGDRLSVTNGADETTTFGYDKANRLLLTRDPLGRETEYRYNGAGERIARIDAAGVETRYNYDNLGRLISVIENYDDGLYDPTRTDEDIKTQYKYDRVGNRTKVIDARGDEAAYRYDDLNRRLEIRGPLSHTTTYGYDAVGNRITLTDANQTVTQFRYDRVNRLATIDYPDPETDVNFTYDKAGNRIEMSDSTGVTTYTYDALYRLQTVNDGAGRQVGYDYDPAGNRTRLLYPDGREAHYSYDDANRLETVTDWHNGQFGYTYDNANRMTGLNLPNGVSSSYNYDEAGRLTLLAHRNITDTLAAYNYSLDRVGNPTTLTETLVGVLDARAGAYLERGGQVVIEAEHGQIISDTDHTWLTMTTQSGYIRDGYLQALPDVDALSLTDGPKARYAVNFTTPGAYIVWLRGYATNAAGDSAYVGLGSQEVGVSGLTPRTWQWVKTQIPGGETANLTVQTPGLYTVSLRMREDGLRVDRLLLTTDPTYKLVAFGPGETERLTDAANVEFTVNRVIDYTYDNLHRLTEANYSTGQRYEYSYDPAGNRLQQITAGGDATGSQYDPANRLEMLNNRPVYTCDANGRLLASGVLTNNWDAANRLIATEREGTALQPIYNGVNDCVAQTVGVTAAFTLDVAESLPEVIYTSEGNAYLHLPGVIVAENAEGEARYLLSDGLGLARQAVNMAGEAAAYEAFDPYGNPVWDGGEPYGFIPHIPHIPHQN